MGDLYDIREDITFQDRFWSKVDVGDVAECWIWRAASNGRYGVVGVRCRLALATHVALILSGRVRPPPPFDRALHSDVCQSTLCVNPEHLRWGSQAENIKDRDRLRRTSRRGRATGDRTGEKNVKLNEDLVRALRANPLSHREAAKVFGVSKATVGHVRARRTWRHVL